MSRTLQISSAIIALTAAIGIGLWMTGVTPWPGESGTRDSIARTVIGFPVFWALLGGVIMGLVATAKARNFAGGKSDAIPAMAILTGPLIALTCQILTPLEAHKLVSDGQTDLVFLGALALFLLIAGNYIVTVPNGSRIGMRNSWTLSDPSVWSKTHRFLGRNLVITTLLVTPVAFILQPENAQWVLLGAVILIKIATIFLSEIGSSTGDPEFRPRYIMTWRIGRLIVRKIISSL